MRPVAIFYHCVLTCHGVNPDHALALFTDQMMSLRQSGLTEAAHHVFIGCNGQNSDSMPIICYAPAVAEVECFSGGISEIPTMNVMHDWCKANPGEAVLYHHIKGVSHEPGGAYDAWRHCMERVCIWGWRECVKALEEGYDSSGAHWLSPEKFSNISIPYWGGNFFWATSDFIATLPPLPTDSWQNRYEAEAWIGRGKIRPRVRDFAPHWPMQGCVPNE